MLNVKKESLLDFFCEIEECVSSLLSIEHLSFLDFARKNPCFVVTSIYGQDC